MAYLNHQHLYYFWVVAQEGSVTKACQRLFLAQPTVSGQIIQLEKSLGVKLFERDKNRLLLTEAGHVAMDHANEIFNTSQKLLDDLQGSKVQSGRRVRLGIDTQVAKQAALQCLQAIYKHSPQTSVTIHQGAAKDLWPELRDRELDVVFSDQAGPLDRAESLIRTPIAQLPIFFAASPALARQVKAFPQDLGSIPLLLPTPTTPLRSQIDQFLAVLHVPPKVIGEIADAEFMRILALEGRGAAPLHQVSVEKDLRSGRLVQLGRRPTGIVKTLWLIAPKHRHENPIVKHLLNRFRID